MTWNIILSVLLVEIVCFAATEPLTNETSNDTEANDTRVFSDRVGSFMTRLYEKSDRYDLISHVLRAIAEHFFALFYHGAA
ncbi:hypothetical protein NPIL_64871 [Nephila pilipes]|uniref:Uncharacterized protein n=1 Tax=Nephila pilipes TaxID=299642 RepID=A0A8X6JCW5_NEPPI|nr:hypothetical protein NPIL_205581 [Nephila pilipes]GFS86592.1 hypothetical protein NPIL_64871 [Nephila pilipes]